MVGVTQKKLFSAYKVSKRESKSISVVDLEKYDFCQKWACPPPREGVGSKMIAYVPVLNNYGHDKKESKSISTTVSRYRVGQTDQATD